MSAPVTMNSIAPMTVVHDWNDRWLLFVPFNVGYNGVHHQLAYRAQEQVYGGTSISVHARPHQGVYQFSPYHMKDMADPAVTQHLLDLPDNTGDDGEMGEDDEEQNNLQVHHSTSVSPNSQKRGYTNDVQNTTNRRSAKQARRAQVHIKRPRNAWLIFRCEKSKELHKTNPGMSAGKISTEVSVKWQALSQELKAYYHALADEEARQHQLKYPGYRYQPGRQ